MYVFDLTAQEERITPSTLNFRLECEFAKNVPAGTEAYALILTSKVLKFKYLKNRTMKFSSSF